jgi:ribosomal protein L37AE/L43A
MKCPFCGSPNVKRIKKWDIPRRGTTSFTTSLAFYLYV